MGGREVAPHSGAYFTSTSPADRRVVAEIADGDSEDVAAAVAAAEAARRDWARSTTAERAAHLKALDAIVREHVDEFAAIEQAECGKLPFHSRMETLATAEYFDYYGGVVRTFHGGTIDQGPDQHTYTRHEPYGVVVIITPWNGALNQGARAIAPALAAGNTIVLKPSEFTSASTLLFARLATEAGLPDGVFNVVTGTGVGVGAPLVSHPAVRKISFTGSVTTGAAISKLAAERAVPVTLELGGKSPLVVFSDSDLDGAARAAAATVLINSGQVCSATTRLLVERDAQEDLLRRIADLLADKQPGRDFGPIITEPQYEKVLGFLESAEKEGAVAVTGGKPFTEGPGAAGYYIPPTVYSDCTPDMRVVREEVFGPVLVTLPFDTVEEAVELANDTPYGLSAAVWAGDGALGLAVAERIDAGQISVNGGLVSQETPFGGYKMSGYGREKGADAIYEHTQVKTVSLRLPN
ncbi:aldehyde dehydrogenase [Streptomyces sp. MNU77]|nr:aldehyde dehydrogenase [Streptomyces sp. MNU77]